MISSITKDERMEPIPEDIADRYAAAAAAAAGRKLRYVASADAEGHAEVGLREVGPESPLYGLRGTDGAGTRQTAGGLLNDIMLSL